MSKRTAPVPVVAPYVIGRDGSPHALTPPDFADLAADKIALFAADLKHARGIGPARTIHPSDASTLAADLAEVEGALSRLVAALPVGAARGLALGHLAAFAALPADKARYLIAWRVQWPARLLAEMVATWRAFADGEVAA